MPDWTKGKIYLIWSPHTDKVYIGSTTFTLNARFNKHIHDIKYNQGCSSEEIINLGDAEIRLIHLCPSFTKQELKFQEGRVMRLFENRVNIRMEGQTEEEIRHKKNEHLRNRSQERKNILAEKKRNRSQEQKDKESETKRYWSQEQKDKCNETRRKRRAAKKAAALA